MKVIEINNEGKKPIWAMACQTKISDHIYIHIGNKKSDLHDGMKEKIAPQDYGILEINKVEY